MSDSSLSFSAITNGFDVSAIARISETDVRRSLRGFISRNWSGKQVSDGSSWHIKRWAITGIKAIVWFHLWFILTTGFTLICFKVIDPGATTLMLYRKVGYDWKITAPRYISLYQIPRATRNMAIKVEDGDFFYHHGIEPSAIKYAYTMNKGIGRPTYGGSTITMQTARTIFLVPEKSYLRKYLEVIIALEMEAILGKERILELYFNYAEWGRGVFGIDAAARYHYKKRVTALSPDQAIRLVTLLSSPIRYKPYTFQRNGILRSRYEYLVSRFEAPEDSPPGNGAAGPVLPPETTMKTTSIDETAKPAN